MGSFSWPRSAPDARLGEDSLRALVERYQQAVAITGAVMSFVLPDWWLGTVAQGEADTTLSALCAVFGMTFIVSALVLARRSWSLGGEWLVAWGRGDRHRPRFRGP